MALMLIVLEIGVTAWYTDAFSRFLVVDMLAARACGMLGGGSSGNGRWPSSRSLCSVSVIFWSSGAPVLRDCGLPDAESPDGGAVPVVTAAAAACC